NPLRPIRGQAGRLPYIFRHALGKWWLPVLWAWLGWRNVRKQRGRFRRLFPLLFFTVAALAILGGCIHAPSNYDALAYRTPRVLHWLAEGRWHWIHTDFQRLNTRGCGLEWV